MSDGITVSLRQQGNSVGVIVPKVYLDALGLVKGSQVDILLKKGVIEMRPHIEDMTLEDLLADYNPEIHNHDLLIRGDVGNEKLVEDK